MADAPAATLDARTAPAAVPVCFHCGLPVPFGGAHHATVLGRSRDMCCAGCEAVARTIVQAGCENFYETRDPARAGEARPADFPPVAIYDDPLAQRQFVAAAGEHGREVVLALEGIRCAAGQGRYEAAVPQELPPGRWNVHIEGSGGQWRLAGEWSGRDPSFILGRKAG